MSVSTASPQSRSTLCHLLWDGSDDPRSSLRWSLTKHRAVVDDEQAQRLTAEQLANSGRCLLEIEADPGRGRGTARARHRATAASRTWDFPFRTLEGDFAPQNRGRVGAVAVVVAVAGRRGEAATFDCQRG
ncbi:hypothetical protein [Piscinibacter sp.]|uniref:hypothetical protein n=1 Tax=Piscinibacter sp. TaxID=1903157 RepID=UPI002CF06E13|nr:hypothetical protein [Albitalea sp.]HUG24377.1 hypothetical protein [Albitalea sp.]